MSQGVSVARLLRLARSVGDHGLYWLTLVVARAGGLLTVPVYARLLGTDDYGRYELLVALMVLLFSLLILGMDFAISVRYFHQSPAERRADLASAVLVTSVVSLSAAVGIAMLSPVLASELLRDSSAIPPIVLAGVGVPFNVVSGIWAVVFRLQFRPRAFFASTVVGTLTGSVLGVILVIGARLGLAGAMVGVTASYVITALVGAYLIRASASRSDLSWQSTRSLLRLGLPLVPAGAALWVFALSDRLFVLAFAGVSQVGLYAAAARVSTILSLIQGGFNLSWTPVALRWGLRRDRELFYEATVVSVAAIGGAGVIALSLGASLALAILAGPDYVSASPIMWMLAGSVVYYALFYVVTIGLNLTRSSARLAWATVIAAIANTALNILLIPAMGYAGAAAATLVAYAVACVVGYLMAERALPMRIGFGRGMVWLGIGIAAAAVQTLVAGPVPVAIACSVAVLLLFAGMRGVRTAYRELSVPDPSPPASLAQEAGLKPEPKAVSTPD
jgi:O-antigen/teichoic acid export membrane protein